MSRRRQRKPDTEAPAVPINTRFDADAVRTVPAWGLVREKAGWVMTEYRLPEDVASACVSKRHQPDVRGMALARIEAEALKVGQ